MTAPKAGGRAGHSRKQPESLVKPRLRLIRSDYEGDLAEANTRTSIPQIRDSRRAAPAEEKSQRREHPSRFRSKSAKTHRSTSSKSIKRPEGIARRKSALVTVVSIAAIAVVVFSVVAGQVMLAQASYSKASAERELDEARAEYERARLEDAKARLPHEIEQKARNEGGFVDAPQEVPLAMGPESPPVTKTDGEAAGPSPAPAEGGR